MNKSELVAAVAEKTNMTKAQVNDVIEATLAAIGQTIKTDEVNIVGFGKFYASDRPAGEARNPRTGDIVKVPASRTPKFKAGASLKDVVNA